jgi:hypothetical protein
MGRLPPAVGSTKMGADERHSPHGFKNLSSNLRRRMLVSFVAAAVGIFRREVCVAQPRIKVAATAAVVANHQLDGRSPGKACAWHRG